MGLYHFRHRSYSPRLGRWLQPDPAGYPDGVNLFEYVRSNPITGFDPWGLEATDDDVGEVIGRYQQHRKQAQQKIAKASAAVIGVTNAVYKATPVHTFFGVILGKDLTKPIAEAAMPWGERAEEAAWAAGSVVGGIVLGKLVAKLRALRYGDDAKDAKNAVDAIGDVARLTDDAGDAAKARRCVATPAAPNAASTSVWARAPTERGIAIESQLAKTDYADWFNVGAKYKGTFPLVDFQKGTKLVSLKTVDTTGTTWMGRMQEHIVDLGTRNPTVNGRAADMILDLRVQPGGLDAAKPLIDFGAKNNVTVVVKEFP